MNTEFHKLVTYFRANKLAIHPDKTKFMIFSTNSNIKNGNFKLNCNFNNEHQNDINLVYEITQVKSCHNVPAIKFLGIFIDPDLSFKYHIKQINCKLSKALFALCTSKNILESSSLKAIYYALFHSHLMYVNIIWTCTTNGNLKDIILKQKIAIRVIAKDKTTLIPSHFLKSLRFFLSMTLFFLLDHNLCSSTLKT
jgi:hypothetical protein